jgi:hypothetical protein
MSLAPGQNKNVQRYNMRDERELYPQDEGPNPLLVFLTGLGILALSMLLVWAASTAVLAEEACPESNLEIRITEVAVPGEDTLWVFEGEGLNTFYASLNEWGLMAGRPSNANRVIVARDKLNRYTVFFLLNGCIVFAAHAPSSVMERILPK